MEKNLSKLPLEVIPAIEAHDVYRFFHIGDDETLALRGVSLAVLPGEMVALTGPSGSGKSTLLACLAGLDEPDGGFVSIAGRRLTRRPEFERASLRAQHLGILLQQGNLLPHLTVAQNVRLQLHLAAKPIAGRVDAMLQAVGLADRARSRPDQLSGGEGARAGLAIALAADPAVLLADEPTGEVDATTQDHIFNVLRDRVSAGRAAIVATHSASIAARADRIIRLRDGKIVDA